MTKAFCILSIIILVFSGLVASAPSSAKIVNGFISSHGTSLIKWLWSLKTTTKKAGSRRKSMVKFENGYSVETVLDGNKLGIEPYSLEVLSNGELLILDSHNSNIYKISSSLSLRSRPRLVTGSPEGYAGHVDGRLRDARFNNPKGLTADDKGNIYVADTANNVIRKITQGGVTTIAGEGHVDGPSEDAKFSNDFDVVYVGSSCSLLVIDRGNQAIREIQLHFDDCTYGYGYGYQYGSAFPLGVAVLIAAVFCGYMVALLQRRLSSIISYHTDHETYEAEKPMKPIRPLIPTGDEQEKQEESFLLPFQIFVSNAWLFSVELFNGMFPGLRNKQRVSFNFNHQETKHSAFRTTPWTIQESFVIQENNKLPFTESWNPTPKINYPFMSKDVEKMQHLHQSRALYRNLDPEFLQEQHYHHRHHSTIPHTLYEQSTKKKQRDRRRVAGAATAKPTEFGDQMNTTSHQNLHYRANQSVSYPYGYYSYT